MIMDAKTKRALKLIAGVGLVAGIGAVVATLADEAGEDEARFRIRELFVTDPDCTVISLKETSEGEPLSAEEADGLLAKADAWYFDRMIKAGFAAGIEDPEEMTAWILQDIFPQCGDDWPPADPLALSKQAVWYAMLYHVTGRMEVL